LGTHRGELEEASRKKATRRRLQRTGIMGKASGEGKRQEEGVAEEASWRIYLGSGQQLAVARGGPTWGRLA